MAGWLSIVPWQLFVTFEFTWNISDAQARKVFAAYIDALERAHHAPIAYLRGDEKRPGVRRHFHAVLASHARLSEDIVKRQWFKVAGRGHLGDSIEVLSYEPGRGADSYGLKNMNELDCDWAFWNLELYIDVPEDPDRPRLHGSARRRWARRHRS